MLKISHISKTFNPGTVNEKKAIEDLSLELKQGDFATIIGSNGAGKSTLFNAICGDFLTDTGSIELDNKDITFMPVSYTHLDNPYKSKDFRIQVAKRDFVSDVVTV